MRTLRLFRRQGTPCETLKLDEAHWTDDPLLDFIVQQPILMKLPIVISPLGTRLCRPSETVLDPLPSPQRGAFNKDDGEAVVDAEGLRVVR